LNREKQLAKIRASKRKYANDTKINILVLTDPESLSKSIPKTYIQKIFRRK